MNTMFSDMMLLKPQSPQSTKVEEVIEDLKARCGFGQPNILNIAHSDSVDGPTKRMFFLTKEGLGYTLEVNIEAGEELEPYVETIAIFVAVRDAAAAATAMNDVKCKLSQKFVMTVHGADEPPYLCETCHGECNQCHRLEARFRRGIREKQSIPSAPILTTSDELEVGIGQMLVRMDELNARIADSQKETGSLQAQTQAMLDEIKKQLKAA